MKNIATIETGITCNNRCVFCYQLRYRGRNTDQTRADLDTQELFQRLALARGRGFTFCHLTGGEPTIRRDFFRLLAHARDLGFEHCGVTTNGRMFANPAFTQRALKLGLDHVSVSIQSADPTIHDRLSGVKGALTQTISGIENLLSIARDMKRPLNLDTMTVVMQPNCNDLTQMFDRLGRIGVRLFGIQPMITNRYNRHLMDNLYCSHAQIRDRILATLPLLRRLGARIRLFNLPPCLFRGHLQYFEFSKKEFTIPEYRPAGKQEAVAPSGVFFKTELCSQCDYPCPGFRMEEYPQREMIKAILGAKGTGHVITNLDLITAYSLNQAARQMSDAGELPLFTFVPGEMRMGTGEVADFIASYPANSLVLIRPARPRPEDNRMFEEGNEKQVLRLVSKLDKNGPFMLGIELGGLEFSPKATFETLLKTLSLLTEKQGLLLVLGPDTGLSDPAKLRTVLREIRSVLNPRITPLLMDIHEDKRGKILAAVHAVFGNHIKPTQDLKEIRAHGFQRT